MTDTKTTLPTLPTMVLPKPVEDFRFDKTKDGWELVENIALEGEPKLQLDAFLREGESSVIGHTMLERAKEMGDCAGQLHVERMLEHQDKIPVKWRNYVLVFTGTVWRRSHGDLYVPCLCWYDGEWRLGWGWLDCRWGGGCRLVRLGK